MHVTTMRALAFLAVSLVSIPLAACSVAQQQIGIDAPPEDQFTPKVGDYLGFRCGTLDCHGQPGRNFRIWGCYGMRLDSDASTNCVPFVGGLTTSDEYHATYRSLVGLEPAVMSQVVQGHGADPELLTFMRKAEGIESHKGGHIITPGDPQYKCLASWLASNTDFDACQAALMFPMFLQPSMTQPDASP
jgi:hypothetical protein